MPVLLTGLVVLTLCAVATPASAYLGPGAGIGAVGAVLALAAALVLAVVGFVWYPLKRLVTVARGKRRPEDPKAPGR